jgi:hypothetical protein
MNIEATIEELKRKSNIINGLAIDWQYVQQLAPQILNNENAKSAPEFKNTCDTLIKICGRVEEGMRELKTIISTFNVE